MLKNTMTIKKENTITMERMKTSKKNKYRYSCACRRRKDEFN